MTATKTQLIGGEFQDGEGNILANGYLDFELNQDENVAGVGNIASGITLRFQLDSDGNVASSTSTPPATNQFVWANDVMLPVNSFYQITGFTAAGQPAWGPNNQRLLTGGVGGGTFDLGTLVPNLVTQWIPPLQPLELEVNGTPNVDQFLLNFKDTASVVWTDNGDGSVSAAASGGLALEVNGTPNVDQALLNFVDTASVTWVDNGDGSVSATASGSSGGVVIAKTNISSAQIKNLSAAPVTLVAAPGLGKVIMPLHYTLEFNFGGTPYVDNTADFVIACNTGIPQFIFHDLSALAGPLVTTHNTISFSPGDGGVPGYIDTTSMEDQAFYLGNNNGPGTDPTVGNGTWVLTLAYYVASLT